MTRLKTIQDLTFELSQARLAGFVRYYAIEFEPPAKGNGDDKLYIRVVLDTSVKRAEQLKQYILTTFDCIDAVDLLHRQTFAGCEILKIYTTYAIDENKNAAAAQAT